MGTFTAKPDLTRSEFTVQKGHRLFAVYMSWFLLSALKFAELGSKGKNKKEKKNDCNLCGGRNAGPLSHFSWSNLEPLFGKQKRAVWLTARDNVKGMKTYTITLAFLLSAHSVAL